MRVKVLLVLLLLAFGASGCPVPCDMSEQEMLRVRADVAPVTKALEDFRATRGFYPAELNDLVPQFSERLPENLGGRKFFYSRESEQNYTLRIASNDGGFYSGSCTSAEIEDNWRRLNR